MIAPNGWYKRLLYLLVPGLVACSTAPSAPNDEPGEPLAVGMRLVLHERLLVPSNQGRTYVQSGQPVHANSIDQYSPYCRLEMNSVVEHPRYIEPDTFIIQRIKQQTELVGGAPWQLAARGMTLSNGATAEAFNTIFYLHSKKQVDVRALFCSHWEDPTGFPEHLSAQQIRYTLQPVFSIEK